MSEFKRAMSYMWSSKAIRRSFNCGFELFGNGGILLVIVIAMSVPLFVKTVAGDVSASVCKWAYVVALSCYIILQEIMVEVPVLIHLLSGKGTGGIPFAKWIMTKGIVINQLIHYVCGLAVILAIHGINMAAGNADASMVDDLLFLPGLFFVLDAVFQWVGSLMNRDGTAKGYLRGTMGVPVVVIPTLLGKLKMSVGTACLFQLLFVAAGVVLMYFSLLRRYKKRSGEHR